MLTSMEEAAEIYGIAAEKIQALIRKGELSKNILKESAGNGKPVVIVRTEELDRYFGNHPQALEDWQRSRHREEKMGYPEL